MYRGAGARDIYRRALPDSILHSTPSQLSIVSASSGYAGPMPLVRPTVQPTMMAKSKALPFLEAPPQLDGSMAGDVGFDPLGLSSYYSLDYMREAEIKHGRVCMLATLGYATVDAGVLAPGAPKVSSVMAHDTCVKSGHMLMLLFTVAIFESLSYTAIAEMMSGASDRKPGDYGIGWKFCKPGDTETQERYALAEITHGRAAMMGFAGMVTQSALHPDVGFPYASGYMGSW